MLGPPRLTRSRDRDWRRFLGGRRGPSALPRRGGRAPSPTGPGERAAGLPCGSPAVGLRRPGRAGASGMPNGCLAAPPRPRGSGAPGLLGEPRLSAVARPARCLAVGCGQRGERQGPGTYLRLCLHRFVPFPRKRGCQAVSRIAGPCCGSGGGLPVPLSGNFRRWKLVSWG